MPLSRMTKLKIFLGFFGLIALVVGYQVARYYYYRAWSVGTRTGYVRKVSLKGPPYCKYIMGELVLQRGGEAAQSNEILEFSVDTKDEESKLVKDLRTAEKAGQLTTIRYRQDLNMWWRCAPTEYFAVGVEK